MSIRKAAKNRKINLTPKDLDALSKLEQDKREAERLGMSLEEFKNADQIRSHKGSPSSMESNDKFKKMSDMPTSKGLVIPDPITGEASSYLDEMGDMRGMEGQFHPVTEEWLKRVGKI